MAKSKQTIKDVLGVMAQQPLGRWLTRSTYTAREHYYSCSTNEVYELQDGTFHIYKARQNRVSWFQASNHTRADLPDDAVAHSVRNFGSIIWCKAPITVTQEAAIVTVDTVAHSTESFETYLEKQPDQ
eukprot:12565160-Ditylum_brightwellii.AAC.1